MGAVSAMEACRSCHSSAVSTQAIEADKSSSAPSGFPNTQGKGLCSSKCGPPCKGQCTTCWSSTSNGHPSAFQGSDGGQLCQAPSVPPIAQLPALVGSHAAVDRGSNFCTCGSFSSAGIPTPKLLHIFAVPEEYTLWAIHGGSGQAQAAVKDFTTLLASAVSLRLLLEGVGSLHAEVYLEPRILTLSFSFNGISKTIPLSKVRQVHCKQRGAAFAAMVWLVRLELDDSRFCTFEFDGTEAGKVEAHYFYRCIQVLAETASREVTRSADHVRDEDDSDGFAGASMSSFESSTTSTRSNLSAREDVNEVTSESHRSNFIYDTQLSTPMANSHASAKNSAKDPVAIQDLARLVCRFLYAAASASLQNGER